MAPSPVWGRQWGYVVCPCYNWAGYLYAVVPVLVITFFFQLTSYYIPVGGSFTFSAILDTSRGHMSRPFSPVVFPKVSMVSRIGTSVPLPRRCSLKATALNEIERPVTI